MFVYLRFDNPVTTCKSPTMVPMTPDEFEPPNTITSKSDDFKKYVKLFNFTFNFIVLHFYLEIHQIWSYITKKNLAENIWLQLYLYAFGFFVQ